MFDHQQPIVVVVTLKVFYLVKPRCSSLTFTTDLTATISSIDIVLPANASKHAPRLCGLTSKISRDVYVNGQATVDMGTTCSLSDVDLLPKPHEASKNLAISFLSCSM